MNDNVSIYIVLCSANSNYNSYNSAAQFYSDIPLDITAGFGKYEVKLENLTICGAKRSPKDRPLFVIVEPTHCTGNYVTYSNAATVNSGLLATVSDFKYSGKLSTIVWENHSHSYTRISLNREEPLLLSIKGGSCSLADFDGWETTFITLHIRNI